MIEVLAKPPLDHIFVQGPIGRGEDANVDLARLVASDGRDLSVIEDPKELPLLQLCWLRDEAAARAAESAEEMLRGEPVDEEPPEERTGTQR